MVFLYEKCLILWTGQLWMNNNSTEHAVINIGQKVLNLKDMISNKRLCNLKDKSVDFPLLGHFKIGSTLIPQIIKIYLNTDHSVD